jgi:putative restriction endonuclease
MNFWWVNQNQTAKQEISGGYMWSPKRNKNGARNAFYENMRECAPGDVVFSFVDTKVATMGIVTTFCEESPRPNEFGSTGDQWDADGWRVGVDYRSLLSPLRPAAHMDVLAPTLPEKYSPLQADGRGNQIYLARVPPAMAEALVRLIGDDAAGIIARASTASREPTPNLALEAEARAAAIEAAIQDDSRIPETERQAIVRSRRGQGVFRERVAAIEPRCRVTGVTNPAHRIASHIKPWTCSDNRERLDGHNGLLLTPHVDHLFDKGFISFADDGVLLISPVADREALRQMGIPVDSPLQTGSFTPEQRVYLDYHRAERFKKSVVGAT